MKLKGSVKQKQKIAVLRSPHASRWSSCSIITPQLIRTIGQVYAAEDLQFFDYALTDTEHVILENAKKISRFRPKKIIFVDHLPNPEPMLLSLLKVYGKKRLPLIICHLYGDFTLQTQHWRQIASQLNRIPLNFICASERQRQLVTQFVSRYSKVLLAPFPIDETSFYSSESLRESTRKNLQLGQTDYMVLSAGRISRQKNILLLTEQMVQLMMIKPNLHFFVAGKFDNIGNPFFGKYDKPGEYFKQWTRYCADLPDSIKTRIHYLGQLPHDVLCRYYNAADLYTSLSTHHDEDFGMAPLEALCCGCPTFLTDWGGYSTFSLSKQWNVFTSVNLKTTGPIVATKGFDKKMAILLEKPASQIERQKLSEEYRSRFSGAEVRLHFESVYQSIESRGILAFSKLFYLYSKRFPLQKYFRQPLYGKSGIMNGYYKEIYNKYTQKITAPW